MKVPKAFAFSLALGIAMGVGVAFVDFDRTSDLNDLSIAETSSVSSTGESLQLADSFEPPSPSEISPSPTLVAGPDEIELGPVPTIGDGSGDKKLWLDSQMSAQFRDEGWASRMEARFLNRISDAGIPVSTVDIECRTSICRIHVNTALVENERDSERSASYQRLVRVISETIAARTDADTSRLTSMAGIVGRSAESGLVSISAFAYREPPGMPLWFSEEMKREIESSPRMMAPHQE